MKAEERCQTPIHYIIHYFVVAESFRLFTHNDECFLCISDDIEQLKDKFRSTTDGIESTRLVNCRSIALN